MAQTFEEYVKDWDDTVAQIEALNETLKPLKAREMAMRKAIAASVQEALGADWKEGMNAYPLSSGRKLKVNNKLKRVIEVGEIEGTRAAFEALNDRPDSFDELLRIKYELDKRSFDKLSDAARHVVSRMLVTKPEAPEVKLD